MLTSGQKETIARVAETGRDMLLDARGPFVAADNSQDGLLLDAEGLGRFNDQLGLHDLLLDKQSFEAPIDGHFFYLPREDIIPVDYIMNSVLKRCQEKKVISKFKKTKKSSDCCKMAESLVNSNFEMEISISKFISEFPL